MLLQVISPPLSPPRLGVGAGDFLILALPPRPPSVLGLQPSAKPPPRLASALFEGSVEALVFEEGTADWGHLGRGRQWLLERPQHSPQSPKFLLHSWQSSQACKEAGGGSVSGNKVPFLPNLRNARHPLPPPPQSISVTQTPVFTAGGPGRTLALP